VRIDIILFRSMTIWPSGLKVAGASAATGKLQEIFVSGALCRRKLK
jgi:hypothetical protein